MLASTISEKEVRAAWQEPAKGRGRFELRRRNLRVTPSQVSKAVVALKKQLKRPLLARMVEA